MKTTKLKGKVINAWSSSSGDDAGLIYLIVNEDGQRKVKTVRPEWYFYTDISEKAVESLESLKKEGRIRSFNKGEKYIKVVCDKTRFKDPNVIHCVSHLHSNGVQTYEADLGPAKRYLLDQDAQIEDFENINLVFFDIETDDRSGPIEYETKNFVTSVKAKDRILSFAAVNRNGDSWYITEKDEKELLIMINRFLSESGIDMLVGWNSKDFDMPYLLKRMEKHGIPNSYLRNILHEDMMRRVQYFYMKDPEARQNITSYSLNNISKYFLKEEKIKFEGSIGDLFDKDPEKLREYNVQDCMLLKKLEDKLGLIGLTYKMFQMCQCTAQNWSMIKNLDNFILSEGNKVKVHFKTNESYIRDSKGDGKEDPEAGDTGDSQEEYLGAFVLDPTPGYYEKVYDLDFKSLYPNIIRTFNISPETYVGEAAKHGVELLPENVIKTPGVEVEDRVRGSSYYKKGTGVIPYKIRRLLHEREEIRAEQKNYKKDTPEWRDLNVKQLVVKELANSIYGVIGNKYFRGFNVNMAESITATGQYLIKHLKEKYEKASRTVVYGDTDSMFVIIKEKEDIEKVLKETNRYLEEHLRSFGVEECTIEFCLDKFFDKFLIESKKKYVGVSNGKTIYVGMECVKRDTVPVAANYQKKLIDLLFEERDRVKAMNWILEKRKTVMSEEFRIEDITIHKKINKDAKLYKAKKESTKKYTAPIHVRIAQTLKNSKGDKTDLTRAGSIISYIVTGSEKNIEGTHISEFKGEWDRKYYWNNLIYPPMERLLAVVFPEVDWNEYCIIEKKHGNRKKHNAPEEI